MRWSLLVVLTISPWPFTISNAFARDLTFEERVKAQEAIDRVYYSHQIGATKRFEEAVPRHILEKKVRTYLKQSVALEEFWRTPVTEEMLRAEMERMARQTRMPERLRELHATLDNDPFLIQECLARPALVDRLSRNFFSYDATIHSAAHHEVEVLREDLATGRLDPRSEHPRRTVTNLVRIDPEKRGGSRDRDEELTSGRGDVWRLELEPDEFDTYRARLPEKVGEIGPVVEEREAFAVRLVLDMGEGDMRIASFVVPKLQWDEWWHSVEGRFHEGSVGAAIPPGTVLPMSRSEASEAFSSSICLADDTWDSVSFLKSPEPRSHHTAVWTGSLMVVWGGVGTLITGGRYDPATDTWTSTSTINAPSARWFHTAVWTGSLMVVWGGNSGDNTGGRYDPVADTWTPTSTTNAPFPRVLHTAVWTGSLMVVWGGQDGTASSFFNTGGRYDPATDTWTSTSAINAPSPRSHHTAVWTGSLMLVWEGQFCCPATVLNTGGRYDPATDSWSPMSTINAPSPRSYHTAVWTGSFMVVWGGSIASQFGDVYFNTGGRYDPATDSWTPTSTTDAPSPRSNHTAVWTGRSMVVWGGYGGSSVNTGGRYDPATDTWTSTSTINAPSPRVEHTAVWTGSRMVVWGGGAELVGLFDTGGRYDPATDTWTPTSTTLSARYSHTAVWTGSLMVVWGGYFGSSLNTGGRYDPATNTWTSTSMTSAPSPRSYHTALWTGSLMVVWGGYAPSPLNTGGRYDPLADTWAPITTVNAPSARYSHTAVWTGSLMVVWGGNDGLYLNTGGRYDPANDSWTPISTTNTPSPRDSHTAIWTGSLMVVWGGYGGSFVNTGGRYDPATDTWTSTSTTNAPSPRSQHTGVWTGSRMVVWGGASGASYLNTGGRYDPTTGAWISTSTINAPERVNDFETPTVGI